MKGAKKLVEELANVQPGEKVLVVTDTNKINIAEAVSAAAYQRGAEVVISVMTPRKRVGSHSEKVPEMVTAAMKTADVIFGPTTDSITSSIRQGCKPGARGLSMGAWTEEMLYQGGINADFLHVKQNVIPKLVKELRKSEVLDVTAPGGTKIKVKIKETVALDGTALEPNVVSPTPDIEVLNRPVTGTAEGTIVVDGAICIYPELGPIWDNVTVDVRGGVIRKVSGGREAKILEKMLKELADPQVYTLAEVSIGLNPESKICGNYFEDEGAYRTMHFGFGGEAVGGLAHVDVVILDPTIRADGRIILRDGEPI